MKNLHEFGPIERNSYNEAVLEKQAMENQWRRILLTSHGLIA
jgi:hypothetical protein